MTTAVVPDLEQRSKPQQNDRQASTDMAFLGKIKRATQQFPSPEELYLSGTLRVPRPLSIHSGSTRAMLSVLTPRATRTPLTSHLNCLPEPARRCRACSSGSG